MRAIVRALASDAKSRLSYIDWMRGLACLLMFQTHGYDAWLSESARGTEFFRTSQLIGSLPAPLFLFLAGVSMALVTDKLRRKGAAPDEVLRFTLLRGAEVFGIAILFRIQQYAFGFPWAPWTDLLRVDVLNLIGLSMIVMAAVCWLAARISTNARGASTAAACACGTVIALATPPMWTTWRSVTSHLPWPLESYLNGVHIFPEPQAWLFPIFPWTALAFAGLATGFVLFSDWAKGRESRTVLSLGAAGVALFYLSGWLDAQPFSLYASYDYWHTSPNYVLARVGVLLVILFACYAWCRWGAGDWGFSPLQAMGKHSLLVYWVHIEFVYGRFSILPKRGCSIEKASLGLAAIFVMMVMLATAWNWWKGKKRAAR